MPIYYVADDVDNFRHECRPVDAYDASAAAEQYCVELFEREDVDLYRPLMCVVAASAAGSGAVLYQVRRIVSITDDTRELGPVEIPADDDDKQGVG